MEKRTLTTDDIKIPNTISTQDAAYYLSMSARIILSDFDPFLPSFNKEEVIKAIQKRYPSFWKERIPELLNIFQQVIKLRPVWLDGFESQPSKSKKQVLLEISELFKVLATYED